MKWIAAILALYLTSCANNQHGEVGQYVYVDCFNTIHIDRDCAANLADKPKTKEERMANMQGVEFIDTCNLVKEWSTPLMTGSYNFCPTIKHTSISRQSWRETKLNPRHTDDGRRLR